MNVDSEVGGLQDEKNEIKERPVHLRYKSLQDGTLTENCHFQAHDYKPPVPDPKALSAKASDFILGVGYGKLTHQSSKANYSRSNKTSGRKQGAFGSSRHLMYPEKTGKTPPGAAKIQALLQEMQPFPPFTPSTHVKHLSDGSGYADSNSGRVYLMSPITTPSPQTRRLIDVYLDKKKKDVVINAQGITRNRVSDCFQTLDEYGKVKITLPDNDHLLNEIGALDNISKKRFWETNIVEIEVDLRNMTAAVTEEKSEDPMDKDGVRAGNGKGKGVEVYVPTVMDQMTQLGKDFFKYATTIRISIHFQTPCDGSIAPNASFVANKSGKWNYPDHKISVGTPGFAMIEELSAKLNELQSVESIEVVVHNAQASTTLPFTLEQLYYALPFYDLDFTGWQLKWQGNYMTEAVDVGHFPTILLDKERNKWLWEKRKAQQEKDRQGHQERLETEERVKRLGEPYGPPKMSAFVDGEGRLYQPYNISPVPRPKAAPVAVAELAQTANPTEKPKPAEKFIPKRSEKTRKRSVKKIPGQI